MRRRAGGDALRSAGDAGAVEFLLLAPLLPFRFLYTEEERRVSALSARVAAPSGPAFSLLDVPADALGSALDATRKKGREQRVLSVNWGAGKMHDQKYLFFFFEKLLQEVSSRRSLLSLSRTPTDLFFTNT